MSDLIENLRVFLHSQMGENFIINLICTFLGAFILWAVSAGYTWYRSKNGLLSGTWHQISKNEDIEKQDEVICRQVGDYISGSIKRKLPDDQTQKKWKFIGRIHGEKVFVIFWSTNPIANPDSYGTIQLHVGDVELQGLYIKAFNEPVTQNPAQHLSTFRTVSLVWKRIK
jgi:uncharacterized membrane protein YqaE (UPF0057 family)